MEKNLRDLAVLAEKEHQQQEDGEEAFVDNVIMYEILSELKDIAARPDGITCACGSGRYGMEIRRSAVDLICRDCGAKLRIRSTGPAMGRKSAPWPKTTPPQGGFFLAGDARLDIDTGAAAPWKGRNLL